MALQGYIQAAYSQEFNARIPHFLPCLLGLYRADGLLVGACGLKLAGSERLYLEQYLEQPIEAAIETRLGAPPGGIASSRWATSPAASPATPA